jgi:hypothetical protein
MYILALCVVFQFKHLIADYFLQGKYMLGKFKDTGWIKPLSAHCAVHVAFTVPIAYVVSSSISIALLCGIIDFVVHFIMDRVKASPRLLGRYKALSAAEMVSIMEEKKMDKLMDVYTPKLDERLKHNTYFWYALGFDQLVHHLTDIALIAIMIKGSL